MTYKIIVSDGILPGFEEGKVKKKLQALFKSDAARIDKILAQRNTVIKRGLSQAAAAKYVQTLRNLGVGVEMQAETPEPPAAAAPMPKPAKPPPPPKIQHHSAPSKSHAGAGLSARLRYRFDSFMAKGGISIFIALMVVFVGIFATIAALRTAVLWWFPDAAVSYQGMDFEGNIFIAFLQATDPGNIGLDLTASPWYKLVGISGGLAGMVFMSALIAFVTTALDQKLEALKRGHSQVIESDYTLILGWESQRVIEILRELIMANESESDACVVILADKDKQEMDDILRSRLGDFKTTRIVTRTGTPEVIANLEMVSVHCCKSAIILATCNDSAGEEEKSLSDAKVIQTILAVTSQHNDPELTVIAEIFNQQYRDIVQSSFPENVVTIDSGEILAKLLVQTSRSTGLSVVYSELLSFDGCEMYFHHAKWGDIGFAELPYHFPDGVPMGIRHADGSIHLNPPVDYRLKADDDILIVADDDSTIKFKTKPIAKPRQFKVLGKRLPQVVEKELIVGWNRKASTILSEYADYIMPGSHIDVMLTAPCEAIEQEIHALDEEIRHIEMMLIRKDHLNRADLISIEPFKYNNIIILADNQREINAQAVDSENIVTLLLLRSIFYEHPEESQNTKLVTEVLDSQNHSLVSEAGVKDVIISNRLISMIIAQVSESRDIMRVYDDIFQGEGSEIYLKPISLYFETIPDKLTFADLIQVAQDRAEVCIGIKQKNLEQDAEHNWGVRLIPPKTAILSLSLEDSLVVLAEDDR